MQEKARENRKKRMREKKILLDTNFLLLPLQFHIDLAKEFDRLIGAPYQAITLTPLLSELTSLTKNKRLPLPHLKIEVIPSSKKGDDAVFDYAIHHPVIVATNDRKLRKRLREAGVKTIFLRNYSKLELE